MAGTQRNGHVQSGGPGAKGGKMRRDYYGAADWRRLAINRSMGWQEGGGGGGVGDLVVTVQDLIKQFMNTKWRPKKKNEEKLWTEGRYLWWPYFPFKDTSRLGKWKSTRQVARDRRWRRFSLGPKRRTWCSPLITFFLVSHFGVCTQVKYDEQSARGPNEIGNGEIKTTSCQGGGGAKVGDLLS